MLTKGYFSCFHVSNRFPDFIPPGFHGEELSILLYYKKDHKFFSNKKDMSENFSTEYVVLPRSANTFTDIIAEKGWQKIPKEVPLWTDKYTSIFSLLRI